MDFSQQRFEAARQVIRMGKAIAPDSASALLYERFSALFSAPLQVFPSLASTNQTAWELLHQGAVPGTAVLALEQTAGRGQWGRQWVSNAGGLYLSVVLTPDLAVEDSAQLTLCTVCGIAMALQQLPAQLSGVATGIPVQIKWLNDLVLNQRKLGGILTETRMQQGRITKAVVGVGINWTNPVPETGITLQSFLETHPTPLIESLEMLTAITLHGLLMGYTTWQQQGIEALLPQYFDRLVHRDRPLSINDRVGTIVGITPTAALRVQLQSLDKPKSDPNSPPQEVWLQPGSISLGYDF